jgi:hypothetical protein
MHLQRLVCCLDGGYKRTGETDRQIERHRQINRQTEKGNRAETGTSHSKLRTGSCGWEPSFHVSIVSYRSFWSDDFREATFQPAVRINSDARRDVTVTVVCQKSQFLRTVLVEMANWKFTKKSHMFYELLLDYRNKNHTWKTVNLLKPTGYVMHQQV